MEVKMLKLANADIGECLKILDELSSASINVGEKLVEQAADLITRFSARTFIVIEDAEKLLAVIGKLMDAGGDSGLIVFAQSAAFIETIISLINEFKKRLIGMKGGNLNSKFSFKSHYCYELALFILLGIVEKSSLIKVFLKTISPDALTSLINSISAIIKLDYLYITQEMSLEVIGRICHYYHRIDRLLYDGILKLVPTEVSSAMRNPTIGIVNLLRNMRDVLSIINATNPNVKSLPISKFTLTSRWLPVNEEQTFETSGYLDVCKEYVCFSVSREDKLIRFQFDNVQRIHFALDNMSVQIVLNNCPDKLNDLFPEKDRAPPGVSPFMSFYFSGNMQTLNQAKDLFEQRLIEAEEVQLASQQPMEAESQQLLATVQQGSQRVMKTSVVSSKMLSPPHPKNQVTAAETVTSPATGNVQKSAKKAATSITPIKSVPLVSPVPSKATPKKRTTKASVVVTSNANQTETSGKLDTEETMSSVSSPDMTPSYNAVPAPRSTEIAPPSLSNSADRMGSADKRPTRSHVAEDSLVTMFESESISSKKSTAPLAKTAAAGSRTGGRGKSPVKVMKAKEEPVAAVTPVTSASTSKPTAKKTEKVSNYAKKTAHEVDAEGSIFAAGKQLSIPKSTINAATVPESEVEQEQVDIKSAKGRKGGKNTKATNPPVDKKTPAKPVTVIEKKTGPTPAPLKTPDKKSTLASPPANTAFHAEPHMSEIDIANDILDTFSVAASSVHTNATSMSKRKYGYKALQVPDYNPDLHINFDLYPSISTDKRNNSAKKGVNTPKKDDEVVSKQINDSSPFSRPGALSTVPRMRTASNISAEDNSKKGVPSPRLSAAVERGSAAAKTAPSEPMLESFEAAKGKDTKAKLNNKENIAAVSTKTTKEAKNILDKIKPAAPVDKVDFSAAVEKAGETKKSFGTKRKFGTVLNENTLHNRGSVEEVTVMSAMVEEPTYKKQANKGPVAAQTAAAKENVLSAEPVTINTRGMCGNQKDSSLKVTSVSTAPPVSTPVLSRKAHKQQQAAANKAKAKEEVVDDEEQYEYEDEGAGGYDDYGDYPTIAPIAPVVADITEKTSTDDNIPAAVSEIVVEKHVSEFRSLVVDTPAVVAPTVRSWRDMPTTTTAVSEVRTMTEVATVSANDVTGKADKVKATKKDSERLSAATVAAEVEKSNKGSYAPLRLEMTNKKSPVASKITPTVSERSAKGRQSSSTSATKKRKQESSSEEEEEKSSESSQEEDKERFQFQYTTDSVPSVAPVKKAAKPTARDNKKGAAASGKKQKVQIKKRGRYDTSEDEVSDSDAIEESPTQTSSAAAKHVGEADSSQEGEDREDHIIGILLSEIVAMQKARASRKRAKVMQTVTSTATSQITQYLAQCKDFAESSSSAMVSGITNKLHSLTAEADKLCEGLSRDMTQCEQTVKELNGMYQNLDREVNAFAVEISNITGTQFAKEEKEVQNELTNLQKRAVEVVKKTIATRYYDRSEETVAEKKKHSKLFKALRDL